MPSCRRFPSLPLALVATCSLLSPLAHAQAGPDPDRLLAVAAQVNLMRAAVPQCEAASPGYRTKFDTAYAQARRQSLDKAGLTPELMARAEAMPELASAPALAKLEKADATTRLANCTRNLDQLRHLGGQRLQDATPPPPDLLHPG
jgi:hypothetical protein